MHAHPVSEQTRAAVAQAEALLRRDAALAQLVAAMDPEDRASTWNRARTIAARLGRFEATAWPRIRAGHRQPRDSTEEALCALCLADTPRSPRRLWGLLVDLGL
jgi:hypothetical protein